MVNHVEKAVFLNDESLVIAQQSGRVLLIDGDNTTEITPDWRLINNTGKQRTPMLNSQSIYFIHGNKDTISLTSGPPVYLPKNPIAQSHYNAISQSSGRLQEVLVYQYHRNKKQWTVAPWSSAHENKQAAEQPCELSLNYDNIVAINGTKTSDYGTAEKVMLIQDGHAYAHFDDSKVHVHTLNNCEPSGLKKVWDFDKILRPAAYYETDDRLDVIALSHSNTIERISINLEDTPPLWGKFCYFFYYQFGIYILGLGLIGWCLYLRRKKSPS